MHLRFLLVHDFMARFAHFARTREFRTFLLVAEAAFVIHITFPQLLAKPFVAIFALFARCAVVAFAAVGDGIEFMRGFGAGMASQAWDVMIHDVSANGERFSVHIILLNENIAMAIDAQRFLMPAMMATVAVWFGREGTRTGRGLMATGASHGGPGVVLVRKTAAIVSCHAGNCFRMAFHTGSFLLGPVMATLAVGLCFENALPGRRLVAVAARHGCVNVALVREAATVELRYPGEGFLMAIGAKGFLVMMA